MRTIRVESLPIHIQKVIEDEDLLSKLEWIVINPDYSHMELVPIWQAQTMHVLEGYIIVEDSIIGLNVWERTKKV